MNHPMQPHPGRFRLFRPILAGATLRERLIGSLGALIGICLTGWLCSLSVGAGASLPLIVAPIGASAVLLFAVPASPLAQPWPIVGGNTISALVGVAVARWVHEPALAIGIAVGLAIAVMSLARCLHPPGGAAALTAVIGGPAVAASGFLFPLVPVGLNSVLLVILGVAFHRLSRRSYPHTAAPAPANVHGTLDPPPQLRVGFRDEDVDAALAAAHETFDIGRDDLARLLREVELQALVREHATLRCADIMSRDVVRVGADDPVGTAQSLLLDHNIRTLPVVDGEGRLAGTVGLRDIVHADGPVSAVMVQAATASPETPALSLLPRLTDGRSHAVVITSAEMHVVGLITQTDLLVALARLRPSSG